jgi:gliding motility-associated-like protein
MAVDNSGSIGTITNSNGDDAGAGFDPAGFNLQGRTSRLGLPNFSQTNTPPLQVPSMTITVGCAGQPSSFVGVGRDNVIENYLWIFGDGQSSLDQNAVHSYDSAGTYTVQLELSNRCDVDTILTQTIEIFNIPQVPTVPPDTALCDMPIVLSAWLVDDPNLSYRWSTGDTTRQITVSNPNIIDVAIIDNTTGCSSDTLSVFVAEARPPVDLGPDLILCQFDASITMDTQVPNSTHAWSIDGVVLGNNRTFDITPNTAGIFSYTVEVTNSFGCIGRDTLQVTVLPAPDITIVSNQTAACGGLGSFDITFNTPGSYTFQGIGPTNFGPTPFDGPGSINSGGALAGNYTLTTTNIVTGCTLVSLVQIEDPTFFGLSALSPDACIGEGFINLNFTAIPANFTASILYEDGTTVFNGALNSGTFTNPVVANLDTGTYSISVQDAAFPFCVETETARINLLNQQPTFTFDATQEICGTQGTISVTDGTGGAAVYTWTGPGIVGSNIGPSITVNQVGIYTVTGDEVPFCPLTETIDVVFNTDPIVDVVVTGDPCEGMVVLEANASNGSGTYVYSWSDGSQAQQNTITTSGTYTVDVVDQLTSCAVTSVPVDVTIAPTFEVILSIQPDCNDNGSVFLTATTNYSDPNISFEWRNSSGSILPGSGPIQRVTLSDRYIVTASNETGTCMVMDSVDVAVVPIDPSDLILPQRAAFCTADLTNPQVDLNPGIFNTYEWRLLPDQTIISTDPVLTVATEGTYEVTLFNGFTCITNVVEVVEDCRPVIHAPNAFSPNGNGINEEFFVFPNENVDEFEIFIYSRWGELVFYSDVQDFRWDGIYRGVLLPVGTYAYIMKFSSNLEPELGTLEQFGSVTLIR